MKIVVEQIEDAFYADIILTPFEFEEIQEGTMIDGTTTVRHRRVYIGVRKEGYWDNHEEEIEESEED